MVSMRVAAEQDLDVGELEPLALDRPGDPRRGALKSHVNEDKPLARLDDVGGVVAGPDGKRVSDQLERRKLRIANLLPRGALRVHRFNALLSSRHQRRIQVSERRFRIETQCVGGRRLRMADERHRQRRHCNRKRHYRTSLSSVHVFLPIDFGGRRVSPLLLSAQGRNSDTE